MNNVGYRPIPKYIDHNWLSTNKVNILVMVGTLREDSYPTAMYKEWAVEFKCG